VPPRGVLAFWLSVGGEFGIGGDEHAKPLRLMRAERYRAIDTAVHAVVSENRFSDLSPLAF
jgi:hypothetical protein